MVMMMLIWYAFMNYKTCSVKRFYDLYNLFGYFMHTSFK